MSMLSDLLSKAQQLELELAKHTFGELGAAKDIAKDLRENLDLAVKQEVGATPPVVPSNGSGVQTLGDVGGGAPAAA